MFRIVLVNMPFADLALPSIALTQIKAVLESKFGDRLSVEVLYLSHDFAKFLGTQFYQFIATSMDSLNRGLGDWLFRQIAFPELPDNTDRYFKRYLPHKTPEMEALRKQIVEKKAGLEGALDQFISKYEFDKFS